VGAWERVCVCRERERERERKKEREYCVHKEIGTKKQKKKGGGQGTYSSGNAP
jgi:hypothetical protein